MSNPITPPFPSPEDWATHAALFAALLDIQRWIDTQPADAVSAGVLALRESIDNAQRQYLAYGAPYGPTPADALAFFTDLAHALDAQGLDYARRREAVMTQPTMPLRALRASGGPAVRAHLISEMRPLLDFAPARLRPWLLRAYGITPPAAPEPSPDTRLLGEGPGIALTTHPLPAMPPDGVE